MSQVNQGESSGEIKSMVGQQVTGFVEATLDDAYLLTVRIGDSNTHLRGIVFKPGHYVPVTEDNDIAPHVPNVHIQRDTMVPAKRKYVRRKNAASATSVGERSSSVAPVLSSSGGPQVSEHGVLVDVHVAEVGEEEKTE